MTFLLPSELVDDVLRPGFEAAEKGARAAGTPFVSFYTPDEMTALALQAGFQDGAPRLGGGAERSLFAGRTDGLGTARAKSCWSQRPDAAGTATD